MQQPLRTLPDGRPVFAVLNGDGAVVGEWNPLIGQIVTEDLVARNTQYHNPVFPVPASISPAQLRIIMRRVLGYDAAALGAFVEQVFSSIPDDGMREDARTLWEFSTTIERSHPLVVAAATQLNLTDAQVDDLFRQGSLI